MTEVWKSEKGRESDPFLIFFCSSTRRNPCVLHERLGF